MPHLILEYSKNIDGKLNFEPLVLMLHKILENKLPTDISSCKTRILAHESFFIGNGNAENAFVHLTIKILAGRSDENKNQLGNEILREMRVFFQPNQSNLILQLSVEVKDLDKHYFKVLA